MNWQLLGLSFIAVFLAELGDKSQMAAIALGGRSKHPRAVFLGTSAALLLASLLGVIFGQGFAEIIPEQILKGLAAIAFAFMGLRLLWPNNQKEESE